MKTVRITRRRGVVISVLGTSRRSSISSCAAWRRKRAASECLPPMGTSATAPIGANIAYREHVSPAAVGYDIGCGNMAVATNLHSTATSRRAARPDGSHLQRGAVRHGPPHGRNVTDHPVLRQDRQRRVRAAARAVTTRAKQLGTVGAGNHYVDLFADETGRVWIGVHFGSRGLRAQDGDGLPQRSRRGTATRPRGRGRDGGSARPAAHRSIGAGQAYIEAMRARGRVRLRGARGRRPAGARHPRRGGVRGSASTTTTTSRGARSTTARLLGDAQGRDPGVPRAEGLRRRDDGRAAVILEGVDSDQSESCCTRRSTARAGDVAHAGGGQEPQAVVVPEP
jgi:hypothetical protein